MAGRRADAGARSVAIAVDLGGTTTRAAALTHDCEILARVAKPTPAEAPPTAVIELITEEVQELLAGLEGQRVVGLGVAAPGPLDPTTGVVFQAPNLPRWRDVPLASELQRRTGLTTYLGNDANLAALAEARRGAGRGARNLVYLTVSTGIGSGMIVDGRLLLGEHGAAAEAGHMAVSLDGPLCGCGNRGCLEAYASGTGVARRVREALATGRASTLSAADPDLDGATVAAAADAGDALAQEVIAEAGYALGIGVRSLLHLFNPSVVVIGGGFSRTGPRLWDPMRAVVEADHMPSYREGLRILPAALGDDTGLIGAALLIHEADLHLATARRGRSDLGTATA